MKLVFATHNQNKFEEVKALLPAHIELLSLTDIGCFEEIEETSQTIEGNAKLKADFIREKYHLDCFADDTGLEVLHLGGAPGVHSSRYAGEDADDQKNIEKLLRNLDGISRRQARFKTVISLSLHNKSYEFSGICEGQITENPRGDSGFGYDPVFLPDGYDQTFAEMPLSLKNTIGHRGKAIDKLIAFLSR